MNRNIKVAIMTLGCRTNIVESDAIAGALKDAGCSIVDFDEPADFYIVNTCTVTHVAARKSRQMLRRAKKHAPGAKLISMGCFSELSSEEVEEIGADLILGNAEKNRAIDYILGSYLPENSRNIFPICDFEDIPEHSAVPHQKAFIKIQDGCNRFCSYCIIPYARGRIRSRNIESIRREVESLVKNGYTEFVLTGIHIASYGKDLSGEIGLIDVIEMLDSIDGVRRIRIGSIEPMALTDDFVERAQRCKKLCDHFHLSLQSGSNEILKRMNRKYTAAEYYESAKRLRAAYGEPAITTDIIVGFPGEGDKEFRESLDFAEKVGFADIHVFPYSVREGTVAARLDGQVPDEIKKQRAAKMGALKARLKAKYAKSFEGRPLEVHVEKVEDGRAYGYSRNFIYISLDARYRDAEEYRKKADPRDSKREQSNAEIQPGEYIEVILGEGARAESEQDAENE